jgi:hypothetical protein
MLVLLCTCFEMSTKMAANCQQPINEVLKLNWLSYDLELIALRKVIIYDWEHPQDSHVFQIFSNLFK